MSTRRNRILAASIAAAALASAAACSSESTTSTEGTTGGQTAGSTKGSMMEGMIVEDAWCRESPMVDGAGACYATLVNHTDADDGLVGATVSSSVAGEVQIHNTVSATDDTMADGMTGSSMADDMADDMAEDMKDDMGSDDMHSTGSMDDMGTTGSSMMSDMMTMVEVDEIEVPAGETVMLKPGGYHIMLMELAEPLEAGTNIELTLEFHESGSQTVSFEVRSA